MSKRQSRKDNDPFVEELLESLEEDPYNLLDLIAAMTRDIGSEIASTVPGHRVVWAQMAMKIGEAAEISKRIYPEGTVFDSP